MEDLTESIVNYSGTGLTRIELKSSLLKTTTLIYDRNALSKLNGLDRCPSLQEFSAADNRIVRMNGVEKLTTLTVLNLPNNSILSIEGLSLLQNLVWLNLSGNSIKVIEGLVSNVNLQHLDVSDNCISAVTDISNLTQLETMLAHGNTLSTLSWASGYLPSSITVISLADNNVDDLNEIASLSSLMNLEQLSVMNNPMTAALRGFDYRPYVISWCHILKILDGQSVRVEERLKAVSLYGQELNSSEEHQVDETVESVLNELTKNKTKFEDENDKQNQEIYKEFYFKERVSLVDQPTESLELQHPCSEDLSVPEQTPENSLTSRPRAAWGSNEGPITLAVSPEPDEFSEQPSQPCQNSNTGDLCDESLCDLLTSDSVYLPLSTPLRNLHPHATPTQTNQDPQPEATTQRPIDKGRTISNKETAVEELLKNKRPPLLAEKTALKLKNTKFDSYDKRPIKPLNQGKSATPVSTRNLHQRPLMQSKIESRVGERKSSYLPVSQTRTGGYGEKDISSPALRSQALSHIKDVAELRKNKRLAQQRQQPGNNHTSNNFDSNVRAHLGSTQPEGESDKTKSLKANADGSRKVSLEEWLGDSVRDSGFLSRPTSDAVSVSDHEKSAAVKIQCVWRGHWARHHCPQVRYVREEMRRRRMEEHILYLKADLQRQKLLYKEEKQLSNLQLEAIKHLWKEVQSLQSWKYEMVSDQSNINSQKHLNKEIENTMEKIEVIRGQGYHRPELSTSNQSVELGTSNRVDLEATCEHLKSQVIQLQETVQGLSSIVTTSHYLIQAFQSSESDGIRVRGCSEDVMFNAGQSVNTKVNWGFISTASAAHSANHTLYPGQPLPPFNLQLHHRGDNSVFISWQPSKIIDTSQQKVLKPLLGYRIYVNDTPVGMVPGNCTVAVAECLNSSQTYRFYVKGVSSISESHESNSVMARVNSVTSTRLPHLQASSTDNSSDESDTENSRGKSPKSKNEQSLQRTKKKSPRREKERTQSTKIQSEKQEVSEEGILSRKDSSSTDELPIYRYPRLHTPKSRTRVKSPDSTLSVVSCDNDPISSDCDTLLTTRPPTSGYSPKTDDSRIKSGDLSSISKSPKSPLSRDSSPKHMTVADKTRPPRNYDSAATTSSVPEPIVCWEETIDRSDVTDSRRQAHKETPLSPKSLKHATMAKAAGSLVSQRQMVERGNSQPVITLSKPRPVLDGKKKPSEGSLKAIDGSAKELLKSSIYERRRTTVSDILEQQFACKQISASEGGVLLKSSTCPPSKIKTIDTLKSTSDEELRRSKSENSSPTDISQPAIGSDGEAPFTIKSRTQGTFVSKLLQKLQTFSKAQEQSIRDSKKTLKLRAKSSSDTTLAVNEGDDNWPARWRRTSGGEESEEEARGVLSDSAQCVTTANQAKVNKGHRRSSSMHGAGPFVVKDVPTVEGTYSPIIMEGGKKKTSPSAGSSGVRRHASFNGILPSRGQDIRPTSEETASVKIKPMTKPAPTESSGQPTFRSRSPSPNASSRSGVHQPVLSAAQLQRLKSPPGIGQ